MISKSITAETYSPYWDGFYAYAEGQPLDAMPTTAHVRGWWAANKAHAEMEAYADDIQDREYHRKGEW
jgi:hypothetical protein